MDYRVVMSIILGLIFIGLIFTSKFVLKQEWKLKDIILSSILGALFAALALGTVFVITGPVAPIFAVAGLGGLEWEPFFGIFLMSGVFVPYIIQKPGVATLVGFLTGFIQILMGSPAAATVWMSGLVQGFGAEVGFALFRYRRWDWKSVLVAATLSVVASFVLAWYRGSWTYVDTGIVALRFLIRWISAIAITGAASKLLADRLAKAGVLKSYPLGEINHDPTSI